MFYYILLILLLTAVSLIGLLLMVRKYYWGPTGQPPKFRPHGGKLREEDAADTRPLGERTRE